jgi:alpha-glucuronidase
MDEISRIDAASYPDLDARVHELVVGPGSVTLETAGRELASGLTKLRARQLSPVPKVTQSGAVLLGTPRSSPEIAGLPLALERAGAEGYVIRSVTLDQKQDDGHRGKLGCGRTVWRVSLPAPHPDAPETRCARYRVEPAHAYPVLNHWTTSTVTSSEAMRGSPSGTGTSCRGTSIRATPITPRACASIGINGAVLTNVNANATSLTSPYLEKTAALAGVLRPYGLRVYLTARFSAPIELGGLKTADPLDPAVREWWKAKIDEIYRYIPDFGGFLVKANSEGQPGPQDYQRTHADGANMLAGPLALHGGVVIWRAFVYSNETPDDRAKQAYNEFVPLDGKFASNVLVQVKNGPVDFQPREPFHPLFGAMPKTPLMMEFQITKEYLGFATHLVYLAPLYEEALDSDTWVKGEGLDGRESHRRRVARLPADRHGRGVQHRRRSKLDRFAFRSGELVRLRTSRLGSGIVVAVHRRRMGAHDVQQRARICRARGGDDDGLARGGGELHDTTGSASPL